MIYATATGGTYSRWFTDAQYQAMDPAQTTWTFDLSTWLPGVEVNPKEQSPYATKNTSSGLFGTMGRRMDLVVVEAPGGGKILSGEILLQSIAVRAASGTRTISVGTTFEGTDIIDNETIRTGENFTYTFIQYLGYDPTIYITADADMAVWIVYDKLTATPT